MVVSTDPNSVKVYTVNGAASGSSSSLPDWLTRKRATKGKGKRAIKEHIEGSIELVQDFEFPEASNRIKTTRDGHHAIATGVYKPQMRVYDLDQLTLKFERHSDCENVDFVILSDDWTKTLHLQADRSIEVHTQGGFHYRTRIPRFGRALNYHFPTCDALIAASGPEIYRLNLDQGRFLNPLVLEGDGGEQIDGVNCIDINPAHQLFGFGVEGNGTVEFWDPRSRSKVGLLRLPMNQLMPPGSIAPTLAGVDRSLSVTAISSRSDGLSYAIGTSTGHTLLYDIRSPKAFAVKDLGYGLPVKNVAWIEGGSRMAGDGMVISADKKVIKIWDRNEPSTNFASITAAADMNHVHHIPGSGLIMCANEGIRMTTYYIPQLGPAPKWCSFLENITEEMEDQTVKTVYEDYKFVERTELARLGLDHLVGTPALKPYMHGYFLSLRLYDAARVIANPFAYAEHREKLIKEKVDKLAETRIRARKDANAPKVNKALAERIRKEEERAKKREERKMERKQKMKDADVEEEADVAEMEVDGGEDEEKDPSGEKKKSATVLTDPRFQELFENPEFEVDEESREFNMLHPSAAALKKRGKTAVELEDDESDKPSSDGLGSGSEESGSGEEEDASDDSSDAGDLDQFDPRARLPSGKASTQAQQRRPTKQVRMAPLRATTEGSSNSRGASRDASFGQRRLASSSSSRHHTSRDASNVSRAADGSMSISWVPSNSGKKSSSSRNAQGDGGEDDAFDSGGRGTKMERKKKGVETFGAGLEKGGGDERRELSEGERKGRDRRRRDVRSGSKNVFRRM
ncbi:hypothetical protein BD410DRAFT_838116 [Rickenella mellea]|uniref:Uncharacterized protein n=1 Tax=Rickenella mellea TaxID=50990 RepID=A0A4Y7QBF2_9AGAM|nr:hypothetical protein BD410DRAFT_838116 [Rickenella mellea]